MPPGRAHSDRCRCPTPKPHQCRRWCLGHRTDKTPEASEEPRWSFCSGGGRGVSPRTVGTPASVPSPYISLCLARVDASADIERSWTLPRNAARCYIGLLYTSSIRAVSALQELPRVARSRDIGNAASCSLLGATVHRPWLLKVSQLALGTSNGKADVLSVLDVVPTRALEIKAPACQCKLAYLSAYCKVRANLRVSWVHVSTSHDSPPRRDTGRNAFVDTFMSASSGSSTASFCNVSQVQVSKYLVRR